MAERGIVDHVTVYRWVHRFAPLLADVARFTRHAPGDRWFVDEIYVKVGGIWRYVHRAVDQHGQIIDVYVPTRRARQAARRFFRRALTTVKVTPTEVVTDAAPVYPRVLEELVPAARHHVEQYANNRVEADHSHLRQRLRPMRSAYRPHHASDHRRARVHAEPSPRHYELATDVPHPLRSPRRSPNSRERSDRSVATASRRPPFREVQQSQSVDELAVPS